MLPADGAIDVGGDLSIGGERTDALDCWRDLDCSNATKMRPEKLTRIEQLAWSPPFLDFSIERHGQTVNGSTRASLDRWRIDIEKGTAVIVDEKRLQLYANDKRLNVIVHGKNDPRIVAGNDGSVRLKISEIVPATDSRLRHLVGHVVEANSDRF